VAFNSSIFRAVGASPTPSILFTPLVDVAVLVAPDPTLSGGFEPVTELVTLKLSDCTSNAGEVLPLALPSPTNSLPGFPLPPLIGY